MVQPTYGACLRRVQTLFDVGTMGGLTDGELLERFTSRADEAAELAFAALVERHGPMVYRVCQSVLRERYDAEDAFQATFLVLIRKADSIRKQSSVASWLHGVAFRIASCQKAATARRRRHEGAVASSEAKQETQTLSSLVPGSEDYNRRENHVAELKARHEAVREQSEREFAQLEARAMASCYDEIQKAVAALAETKGLAYVVKVTPIPGQDAPPSDVIASLDRSVVYSHPRYDLTDEVIRELNRRFKDVAKAIEK